MANRLVKLLRRVGGATPELDHADVSQKTRNGYTVLGVLMFVVAVMSSSIAGFTWASVMHLAGVGILVTLVWFCFSLALNYMMAWIIDASRGKKAGMLVMVTAILLFGALISAVNTNFVMLWMMDAEIKQTLQANYQSDRAGKERELAALESRYNSDLGALRLKSVADIDKVAAAGHTQLGQLKADADKARAAYTQAFADYTAEVRGQGPSRLIGIGQRAKAAKEQIDALKAVMDAADKRLADAQARLDPASQKKVGEIKASLAADEKRLADELATDKSRVQRTIDELDLVPRDGFVNRDLAL